MEIYIQVTEDENIISHSSDENDVIDKQYSENGTWIKWGTGYLYTNHKDLVMDHLVNVIKPEETTTLESIECFEEHKAYKNNSCMYQIDTNVLSVDMFSNHCITDAYGDRYFDLPIYLLHVADEKVNEYFQVEARKLRLKKRLRLIRFTDDVDHIHFDIEQILFQNKPTNYNIVPILENAMECNEYYNLDHLDNCLVLSWQCKVCNVKSDHWTKLNKHNCTDDKQAALSKKNVESKHTTVISNNQENSRARSQHICPHCNGEFDSEGYLRTHMQIHANDSNKCPLCDQPIAPEMMNTHLIAHQNPEFANLKFLCKYETILLF